MNVKYLENPDPARLAWRASSYSGGQGECVQVADGVPDLIPVRDSKRPTVQVIAFPHAAWRAFVATLG
ncbi:DUF397 domain-containing protein [Streptomyces sp. 8K308]|uniref:DUF397 domain-containing protein n=1 Tax=Streptomyces sp. 8K308 TaxID=2530388 RepID=UPI0010521C92|nr:DUF397 domain-containing protein [Streptomyces sp. 8K308]TDC25683.1 DUF397 domain-containing protein [Streptomyces sp. 8K308]